MTSLALVALVAGAPLAPDNGCRCTDIDPTLAAFTRLAAAFVWVSTGQTLTCHNGRRRGGLHEQGRAVDLVLNGSWDYWKLVEAFEVDGPARRAMLAAGRAARGTGIRWGFEAWGRVDEVGHFERPAGVRWPAPTLLLAVLPNAGGCR